ncbi:MAG: hypothetical protein R2729_02690 [Bryobacteraceae bacterium]
MTLELERDNFGRLICTIEDGERRATVTSHTMDALAEWLEAIENTPPAGYVDCYWSESAGNYRWMFRTVGDLLRIYITWGSGAGAGWEHIFSGDYDAVEFRSAARAAALVVSR